jgi:secondary thiamine-phosphate synthase enzyme
MTRGKAGVGARLKKIELGVRTSYRDEFVDITERVQEAVEELGLRDGFALVYVPHTTAGVTINEGADPAVRRDLLKALARIVPQDEAYEHAEGNSPAHVKASLMGSSVLVPVERGTLKLGRWQSVYLCEFDGPRSRSVWVASSGAPSAAK